MSILTRPPAPVAGPFQLHKLMEDFLKELTKSVNGAPTLLLFKGLRSQVGKTSRGSKPANPEIEKKQVDTISVL
jgi:hypothetical protein